MASRRAASSSTRSSLQQSQERRLPHLSVGDLVASMLLAVRLDGGGDPLIALYIVDYSGDNGYLVSKWPILLYIQ